MAPIPCHDSPQRPPSSGYHLPSLTPSLISRSELFPLRKLSSPSGGALVSANWEARGLRRKTKWRSGKGGSAECGDAVIKKPYPLFAFKGFLETAPRFVPFRIPRSGVVGRYLGFCSTAAHIAYSSTQLGTAHRIFVDFSVIPSRLSNFYCTTIITVFSPRFA